MSPEPDVLAVMKIVNALAGVSGLIIVRKIMLRLDIENLDLWILFIGTSFGVMRFATENETYLIPICLSLLSGYWILRYLTDQKDYSLLIAGLLAALACLYHQVQIFWWFGFLVMLVRKKSIRTVAIYLVPGLVIPVVYSLVLVFYEKQALTVQNFFDFILHDYMEPGGGIKIGLKNIVLTPVNFIRTFFQIHGYIFYLLKQKLVYIIPGIVCLLLMVITLLRQRPLGIIQERNGDRELFRTSILYIFFLQLVFAFISEGNAEFMVSFPFLAPIILALRIRWNRQSLKPVIGMVLVWNFFYGLLPAHNYRFYDYKKMMVFMEENKDAIYVLEDRNIVVNQYYFYNGVDMSGNVFPYPIQKNLEKICGMQSSGKTIFTDVLNRVSPINRKQLFHASEPSNDFILIHPVLEMDSFFGPFTLDCVILKCDPETKDNK